MENYRIFIKPSAAKELEAGGARKDRTRLVAMINSLAIDPRPPGCQKLTGSENYTMRQGAYRVVYSIEDDRLVATVVRVAHRRDVYRGSAG